MALNEFDTIESLVQRTTRILRYFFELQLPIFRQKTGPPRRFSAAVTHVRTQIWREPIN
jgi:hypothetical protein